MASKFSNIEVAAAEYGCQAEELLKFRPGDEEGSFVVISPVGEKFTYTGKVMEARRKKMEEKAKPKPRARRTPAKAKPLTQGSKPAAKPKPKPKVVPKKD